MILIATLSLQTMSTISKGSTVNVGTSSTTLGPMGSLVGPGGQKISVLKATYLNQYKNRFAQASSHSLSTTSSVAGLARPTATPPTSSDVPPPPKKRKSRWD